jgi:hypothetical protein
LAHSSESKVEADYSKPGYRKPDLANHLLDIRPSQPRK